MHSFRVYSFLHITVNLTQTWVSALVVNLFLCLDCLRDIIPWDWKFFRMAMLTTARSLLHLCMSFSCLEQVNSPPNLLSVLPTPAHVHRTAERSSTGTNPPRGSTPKLGAMRPFSLHLQSLQSQMQHEQSEQSLPLPSGVRGGCSALPGYTEHLPQRFQTAPLPTGRGCNLAVHQLGVMGKIFSSSFCRKSLLAAKSVNIPLSLLGCFMYTWWAHFISGLTLLPSVSYTKDKSGLVTMFCTVIQFLLCLKLLAAWYIISATYV